MLRYFHRHENFTARHFNGYPKDNFRQSQNVKIVIQGNLLIPDRWRSRTSPLQQSFNHPKKGTSRISMKSGGGIIQQILFVGIVGATQRTYFRQRGSISIPASRLTMKQSRCPSRDFFLFIKRLYVGNIGNGFPNSMAFAF